MPTKAEIQELVQNLVLSREDITYTHPIFMQCFLPQRSLKKGSDFYQIDHGKASLAVTAGRLVNPREARIWEKQEIPAGPKARLLVAYINDQAIRSKSPTIDMGSSLREFMARNGIPVCGSNGREVIRQAKNLAAAEILLGTWGDHEVQQSNMRIAKGLSFWIEKDPQQGTLWSPELQLSEDYLGALLSYRVPVDFRVLVALQANPRAMDIYCWLSYRLATLTRRTVIPFEALHPVFGPQIKQLKHFKSEFMKSLKLAVKYYSDAKVSAGPRGITLRPSPNAIPASAEKSGRTSSGGHLKPSSDERAELDAAVADFLVQDALMLAPGIEAFLRKTIPPLISAGLRDHVIKITREAKTEATNPPGYLTTYLRRLAKEYSIAA